MAVLAFLLKPSLLSLKSSAASLFNGSEALGSRKRNWTEVILAQRKRKEEARESYLHSNNDCI
jgi:hypothetical protein